MRIDPATNFTPVAGNPAADGVTKMGPTKAAPSGAQAGAVGGGFAPTADLTRLLQLVKEVPDVRADVVQDVLARSDAGELTTPQAALDTAAAVADSSILAGG